MREFLHLGECESPNTVRNDRSWGASAISINASTTSELSGAILLRVSMSSKTELVLGNPLNGFSDDGRKFPGNSFKWRQSTGTAAVASSFFIMPITRLAFMWFRGF